jgi:hypothetical protein
MSPITGLIKEAEMAISRFLIVAALIATFFVNN